MSETIIREWYFLLCSMLTGIFFAFVYDQIRLFRRLWRHGRLLVDVEDILYWTFCFFASFYLLYYGNYGVVRFFAVLGAAIGMFFYSRTIGRIYVKSLYRIIMLLLAPYRFVKIRLTRIRNHFTIKMRDLMRAKRGEGEKHAAKPCKTKKGEACISAQKK
ncbi:MAG: spore cortex biosynthesis protein YabQ [Lachnospiraceae bacterium]|nr:spore cortex biosynthesis protein YabQ [Lachnospiraceae bacterium]MBQ6996141.1 spore cortex biosynthesis protein YabQ [Lachnospiraceae bacterium]